MTTLEQISAMAMDLYYQNYKTDESFFDLSHFQFLLVQQYAKVFSEEAANNKRENKSMTGYSYIEISPDWMIREEVEVLYDKERKQYYAQTSVSPFVFKYDAMDSGVQYVSAIGDGSCGDIKRIAQTDVWMLCNSPATAQSMYYVQQKGKVILVLNEGCRPKKVEMQYVPNVSCDDKNSLMREDLSMDIMMNILTAMFGARQGVTVDMANNSNPNIIPQGEVDPNALKQ